MVPCLRLFLVLGVIILGGLAFKAFFDNSLAEQRLSLIEGKLDHLEMRVEGMAENVGIVKNSIEGLVSLLDSLPGRHPVKYLTIVPGYGPNNQYLGLKDVMYMTKALNRTLALPSFIHHQFWIDKPFRPFEKTFDPKPIESYLRTVSMHQFVKACEGVVNTLVWLRKRNDPMDWTPVINGWMTTHNLTWEKQMSTTNSLFFRSKEEVAQRWSILSDTRCIAIMFPFRNVVVNEERAGLSRLLVHSQEVKKNASRALAEIKVNPQNLLSIHWRWGEDTCGKWLSPEPRTSDDFCWGTAVFHFASSADVFESLKKFISNANISHIFLAVSALYHDKEIMVQMQKAMTEIGISIFTSSNLKSLGEIKDNYYLSLVEQEMCSMSRLFVASGDSTWSDFIRDYHEQHKKLIAKGSRDPSYDSVIEIVTFEELLNKDGKQFTTWNRVVDQSKLDQRLRGKKRWDGVGFNNSDDLNRSTVLARDVLGLWDE
eukprot:TRINITY_DN4597_c0_g1_i3.p1 TRINITY_DN4597_c0_g1~~TRINITY_DN4597_c0_g1_i3.p1  ORF type:complete len:484 (-),score=80.84 TRINITY_DN4597_c0_g1_i3:96-1547(-)